MTHTGLSRVSLFTLNQPFNSADLKDIEMSDSDFDDDDDEAVLQLMRATQSAPKVASNGAIPVVNGALLQDLFRAQGEIAILRAQLESMQRLKAEEAARLNAQLDGSRDSAKDQIDALKLSVDKLEDEKRFLRNEVMSLSATKRRKVSVSEVSAVKRSVVSEPISTEAPIQIKDDWLQLCHHLWHYTINGSDRTSMELLSRVCLRMGLEVGPNIRIEAESLLLDQIWAYFMTLTHLRLDGVVSAFCELVLALVCKLLEGFHGSRLDLLLGVPFLLSLVYAALSFKPLAVSETLASHILVEMGQITQRFVFVLQLNDEEEETLMGHENVTYQQRLLENFTLVVCLDVIEYTMVLSTQFGMGSVRGVWQKRVFDPDLLQKVLPDNTERFVNTFQINVVFNVVEILFLSLSEDGFATGDEDANRGLVKSLIKAFLIDIDIKEDFLFYGLNRMVGNNTNFESFVDIIPHRLPAFLNSSFTSIPCPAKPKPRSEKEAFDILLKHDHHLLSLKIRIATLLESVIVSGMSSIINLRENIKLIVRVMGFEQNLIMQQPRYQYVYMRIQIIAILVRMLYYIIDENKNINTLIYPETLYEILVVLMRIAFGSDSLSLEAHKLLAAVRARGALNIEVFNRHCELRSREIAHLNIYNPQTSSSGELADVEGDFANGLEFPYDSETIEIAREILGVCLNHDEADNLYFNMTSQVP